MFSIGIITKQIGYMSLNSGTWGNFHDQNLYLHSFYCQKHPFLQPKKYASNPILTLKGEGGYRYQYFISYKFGVYICVQALLYFIYLFEINILLSSRAMHGPCKSAYQQYATYGE